LWLVACDWQLASDGLWSTHYSPAASDIPSQDPYIGLAGDPEDEEEEEEKKKEQQEDEEEEDDMEDEGEEKEVPWQVLTAVTRGSRIADRGWA
jgi:hypothetical protein